MTLSTAGLIAALFAAPSIATAQDTVAARPPQALTRAQRDTSGIPVSARPPAGMCRIWLDDVPVAQQPAPTDCASAVRNRPAKGRVIFGDDFQPARRESTNKTLPFVKGFAPQKQTVTPPKPKPDTIP